MSVYLQSVIPKRLVSKVKPDIIHHLQKNYNANINITPLSAQLIPNSILTVDGNAANVAITYMKLHWYFNGNFIDSDDDNLKQYYVRGLDKIHRPAFLIPHDFKLQYAKIDHEEKIKEFKRQYKSISLLPFENWSYDIWNVDKNDVSNLLKYLLLNTTETGKFFQTELQGGLMSLTDDDLITADVVLSKKDLDFLQQDQAVRYTHLCSNYLCDIKIDTDLYDDEPDRLKDLPLIKLTGPAQMVANLEKMFEMIKTDYRESNYNVYNNNRSRSDNRFKSDYRSRGVYHHH